MNKEFNQGLVSNNIDSNIPKNPETDMQRSDCSTSELQSFKTYLLQIVVVLLNVKQEEFETVFESKLDNNSEDICRKFLVDPALSSMVIEKLIAAEDNLNPKDINDKQLRLRISEEVNQSEITESYLTIIKKADVIDFNKSFQSQVNVLKFSGPKETVDPYGSLYNYIHHAIGPYLNVITKSSQAPGKEHNKEKAGTTNVKKKLAEFELSVLQLQHNIEIPDVTLNINPYIQDFVDKKRLLNEKVSIEDMDQDYISKPEFLNKLQSEVNIWIREIQKVTKLKKDIRSGTATQEISFWNNLEQALLKVENKLKCDEINILKQAKRFHATLSFDADTGLREAMDTVSKYNVLMKEFPINELLSALDIDRIRESLIMIFGHLNKKLRISPYPIKRTLSLVEAISRDFNDQLIKILSGYDIMNIPYMQYEQIFSKLEITFNTWDTLVKEFISVAREVTRKRSEKFILIKINPAHTVLFDRLQFINAFRKQHEQLYSTLLKVSRKTALGTNSTTTFSLNDIKADEEIKRAYEYVKLIDILDLTKEGLKAWINAENNYNEQISILENKIIIKLKECLSQSKTTNEMFKIFTNYSSLLIRPKIKGAIQEYQAQLIESVKTDINSIQTIFKRGFKRSPDYSAYLIRDMPPLASNIRWVKILQIKLEKNLDRVAQILGKNWENHAEGKKIYNDSQNFIRKLDTKPMFEAWVEEISKQDYSITGRIFKINRIRDRNIKYVLAINFYPEVVGLFKEVRSLSNMKFQIPHNIRSLSKDAKRVYPYAICLIESIKTYNLIMNQIETNSIIYILLSLFHKETQELIAKGIDLRWDYLVNTYDSQRLSYIMSGTDTIDDENRHIEFVKEMQIKINEFYEKYYIAQNIYNKLEDQIKTLAECEYNKDIIRECYNKIQKLIDTLDFQSFSNLNEWVYLVNEKIQNILIKKLKLAIISWISKFDNSSFDFEKFKSSEPDKDVIDVIETNRLKLGTVDLPTIKHEISILNQTIYLEPSIEKSKELILQSFHEHLSRVCSLPRINNFTFELKSKENSPNSNTYDNMILLNLNEELILNAYKIINDKIGKVDNYIKTWFQYQALWDLEYEKVFDVLGEDLNKWQKITTDIKKARITFDNSVSQKVFGNIIVNYSGVQSKVASKYDIWQRDILKEFSLRLNSSTEKFYKEVNKSRNNLENFSLENSSTSKMVDFITLIEDLKIKVPKWTLDIEIFLNGHKTIESQRFSFPSNWIYPEQIKSEWSSFNEILNYKNDLITQRIDELKMKIEDQDKTLSIKSIQLLEEWANNKPTKGDMRYDDALNIIKTFELKLNNLNHETNQIKRAKSALNLYTENNEKLEVTLEEIKDLKFVWESISVIWKSIYDLYDLNWNLVIPRKIRQILDNLLKETKDMNSSVRQYPAFTYLQEKLREYLKTSTIITELKSEALKDRHWKEIFKKLNVTHIPQSNLTLGNVWKFDILKHQIMFKEIIEKAQGEMALEEYLKQIKETWTNYNIELIGYQNKCRLIKGWDDLLVQLNDNLNSLNSMKMSPYYKIFEEQVITWEEKLSKIQSLFFDVWIDVQRQWVYLEGIFMENIDIKYLLPMETSRFQNINLEFMTIMKKVYKSPYILDVINIPNIYKSLDRIKELLTKIKKALGEYLEKERSNFPRFYFVGDEDLLEIIGNSKDISRIQGNFKRMFSGVESVIYDKQNDITTIKGIISKEQEIVNFKNVIEINQSTRINEWLNTFEKEIKFTLAKLIEEAVKELRIFYNNEQFNKEIFEDWINKFPDQIIILALQITWTNNVEENISNDLSNINNFISKVLKVLSQLVLENLENITLQKCQHLINELVHQQDVVHNLDINKIIDPEDINWSCQLRYYLNEDSVSYEDKCFVIMADAKFNYGFEYLGVVDKLVQTNLTDKCFLTLTQALKNKLGGSPFGPAGTGKTESVKALGNILGRFVLVFCCDENFDYHAIGRILIGICQVGAWGCFDEFNRLDENMLSSVSQQIQSIQTAMENLNENSKSQNKISVDIIGKKTELNPDIGIFVTMNPGYAGRSNLPDNLKRLFRPFSMSKPDKQKIAQVMLYSQGFGSANILAHKVVPLFNLCTEQLSTQSHYDFGLRALKTVLISAGSIKRTMIIDKDHIEEQDILIQSLNDTIIPRLILEDVSLFKNLINDIFSLTETNLEKTKEFNDILKQVCKSQNLIPSKTWAQKVLELYKMQKINHGIMLVGPSGEGKSTCWRILLKVMSKLENCDNTFYVIDPKAITKETLYGFLDTTTRDWTDGLFTHILRKIIDNIRGESIKRHWIIFDGDVDPEWVENLNSVLDDNKILTLPNGERLNIPNNVRILFEVENLNYATLATVSRCGMIWFNEHTLTIDMIKENYFLKLKSSHIVNLEEIDVLNLENNFDILGLQEKYSNALYSFFEDNSLVKESYKFCKTMEHTMDYSTFRTFNTLFCLINKSIKEVCAYNIEHSDFQISDYHLQQYIHKKLLIFILWSFGGDLKLRDRYSLNEFVCQFTTVEIPVFNEHETLFDFDVEIQNANWVSINLRVPNIDIDPKGLLEANIVIPTIDTIKHENILYSLLAGHEPMLLCGPPGSGKTMTLLSALRKCEDLEVIPLNFSSASTPDLIIKTFEQYCEFRKTSNGLIMSPSTLGKWLVIFCDEINLPKEDKYGTQKIIFFLRQLIEQKGYWRSKDKSWIKLERIQFVGACNPPTDPGRVKLSNRFLRHTSLVFVDYPGQKALFQIYNTFNNSVLKIVPELRGYSELLTTSMIEFYLESKTKFTTDIQSHYIYSPRELTRWVKGIYETIKPIEMVSLGDLIRIWAHEAIRLFQDRLVDEDEKIWTDNLINLIISKNFPMVDIESSLKRPILFSNWLSKNYVSVDQDDLKKYISARLKTFCEEELDVQLVLFDSVIEHVLRIDRVFRQPQGHLLMIGISGAGKTTLTRFVAWINGLNVFQIKAHNNYTASDFDDDLRNVLLRVGCKGEKICFILDETNVLDAGFLERMNTLLANAEIPGLFEGDDHLTLITQCKESAQKQGLILDSEEELYKWFTQQIMRNLHVVFTMNPPESGFDNKPTTSPALFNRCVLNWVGDWKQQAFYQVGKEFTDTLDVDVPEFKFSETTTLMYQVEEPITYRKIVINAFVFIHYSIHRINDKLKLQDGQNYYNTPRHFLDFVFQYVKIYMQKKNHMEDQQRHLNIGLQKLNETVNEVEQLRKSLSEKNKELETKNNEANTKLTKMVENQQAAEKKKEESVQIQKQLEIKNKQIEERKVIVIEDLAKAEPAVLEAQKSVKNIKKQHLTEVRSMANPPLPVKIAMESVCILLGHKIDSWKSVQGILRRDDFISSIENFDTKTKITKNIREKVKNDYISNPNYNFENVNRASKACGPLVKWVIAQIDYSSILDKIGPLRKEVETLEKSATETQELANNLNKIITELENSIEKYKQEYAFLISEVQQIKNELARVQDKVNRSVNLLSNLSQEKNRWNESSKNFETEIKTLPGDVLLSAAYITYCGQYTQNIRETLLSYWKNHLENSNIFFRNDLSIINYLSTPNDRVKFENDGLSNDDLLIENAIILENFNRYPLIIDPLGKAVDYIKNKFIRQKVVVTSFLDNSIYKNLESSLRFGNPIIIQDVERIDPIINPILNKELRKTGGRVLMRLGNQDIDYSPSFTLVLSTRNSSIKLSPDLCSRVSIVNFTTTKDSLQKQCLNEILKKEAPEVERQRIELNKLQGEFKIKLRNLENSLLLSLSEAQGNILDNEEIVASLETIKTESKTITKKVDETDDIINNINATIEKFIPLSIACSNLFFLLEHMSSVNSLYQFSLSYFNYIFYYTLNELSDDKNYNSLVDTEQKLEKIKNKLFLFVFNEIVPSLLEKDIPLFMILMSNLYLKGTKNELPKEEYDFFCDNYISENNNSTGNDEILMSKLPKAVIDNILNMSTLAAFKNLLNSANVYFDGDNNKEIMDKIDKLDMQSIPDDFYESHSFSNIINLFRRLLIVKNIAPHKVFDIVPDFTQKVFEADTFDYKNFNFEEFINKNSHSQIIVMCAPVGYDSSHKIDEVIKKYNHKHHSIAMGSSESQHEADKALVNALKYGGWVILKNVHLCIEWISQLEKKLHNIEGNKLFKLFITTEANNNIPKNLLLMSRVVIFEPKKGLRSNIKGLLTPLLSERRQSGGPIEQNRLFFLMAWLHSVFIERTRYIPLGWSKNYEFGDTDYEYGIKIISSWIINVSKGRQNIGLDKLPFKSIKTLLKNTVYGSKVDIEYDLKIIDLFIDHLFSPKSFEQEYNIFVGQTKTLDDKNNINISGCIEIKDFIDAIDNKEVKNVIDKPKFYGLPFNSDKLLNMKLVNEMTYKLRTHYKFVVENENNISNALEDRFVFNKSDFKDKNERIIDISENFLKNLPSNLIIDINILESENSSPIVNVFKRELLTGRKLLHIVKHDLTFIVETIKNNSTSTNYSRYVTKCILDNTVPKEWKEFYKYDNTDIMLAQWLNLFRTRIARLTQSIEILNENKLPEIWIDTLFYPESYLTATRQMASRISKIPLENLSLKVDLDCSPIEQKNINDLTNDTDLCFNIRDIKLEGGKIESPNNKLIVDDYFGTTSISSTLLRWVIFDQDNRLNEHEHISLPLYANSSRSKVLMNINVTSLNITEILQYGVAFVAQ